jgi:LysR family transcriptional regulator, hydrogen peroxide-inducible genes activator
MEMHQARYFIAMCETLNFTRAAEKCNVSQPSLTRAIQLLEHELGGLLFHRERNHTHLTDLGRRVEPSLREVVEAVQAARARAGAFAKLTAPVLQLGIARGIPLAPLLTAIVGFARAHPGAEIVLPSAEAPDLLAGLRSGELEMIVVPRAPAVAPDDLHYYRLTGETPLLVLPAGHPLTAHERVPELALAGETIICVQNCAMWQAVEQRLGAAGHQVRPRLVVARPQWLLEGVRGGLGIGLVSRHQALGEGLEGRLLLDPPLEPEITLATKRGRLYSPPARAFVEIALTPRRAQPAPVPGA